MKQRMTQFARVATVAVLSVAALHAHADAKQDQIKRLPSLQKSELDALATDLAQNPARQIMAQAQNVLLQVVPPEKREGAAKQITAELTKFVESSTPDIKASANKVAVDAVTPVMSGKFSEEELKQLVVMLNSPIIKKYQEILPELNQALLEKISADSRAQFEPKVQSLQTSVRNILDTASGGKLTQAAAAQAKAAANASKPTSKK